MVSIIVPVYNVEEYLRECVDSILNQTYSDVEVILVDDGSTDQSGNICDEYAKMDSRIKMIHKKNGGVSAARNTGIGEASGEYLMFVDSDDAIHPELVEAYMTHLSGCISLCDFESDQEKWRQFQPEKDGIQIEQVERSAFMKLFYMDYMNVPFNKLFRADMIKENNILFPEGKSLGEDLIFNLDYIRAMKTDYQILHGPFYYYRENRSGSLSNSARKDLFAVQKELFGELRRFLQEMQIWTAENRAYYYGILWDRLYLTAKRCRELDSQMFKDSVWKEAWNGCRENGVCTWKRRLKKLQVEKWRKQYERT